MVFVAYVRLRLVAPISMVTKVYQIAKKVFVYLAVSSLSFFWSCITSCF